MTHRFLGFLSAVCLFFTILWLALLIVGQIAASRLDTFERVLAYTSRLDSLFYLTYLNAAMVTLCVTALFAGLYGAYRDTATGWAEIGLVFIPVYAMLNLVVYLSQVTVVPPILSLRADQSSQAMAEFFLRQAIQQWPVSAIAVTNSLAYAVLGAPSMVFGRYLMRASGVLQIGGVFMILNAVACILGFAGVIAQSALLSLGSLFGGVLFLAAVAFMAVGFMRQ